MNDLNELLWAMKDGKLSDFMEMPSDFESWVKVGPYPTLNILMKWVASQEMMKIIPPDMTCVVYLEIFFSSMAALLFLSKEDESLDEASNKDLLKAMEQMRLRCLLLFRKALNHAEKTSGMPTEKELLEGLVAAQAK